MSALTVTLYTNDGCAPCDTVAAELRRLATALSFELRIVDLATDPEAERRYRWAVPVIELNGREALRAPIRPGTLGDRLSDAIAALGSSA